MKIFKFSVIALSIGAFISCATEKTQSEEENTVTIDGVEVEISAETQQKSEDIGIPVGTEKDLDGDGVSDVMLTADGNLVEVNADDHVEVDNGEVEVDHDKIYELEYNEKKGKWEIDVENEVEQSVEKAAKGVKNAAKDVGDAVEDVFDGKDDKQ